MASCSARHCARAVCGVQPCLPRRLTPAHLPGRRFAALAPDLGSLASADWWLRQGAYQPPLAPDWVLQEATRDVLQVGGGS